MAKIVRYNGNLVPFASASLGTERTVFGDVTQADDITSQFTPDFLRGWGIVGPSDQPTLQDFNAVSYTHGQILAYLHQSGVAEYNPAQVYYIGGMANYNGALFSSLQDSNAGNIPASSPEFWRPAFTQAQPGRRNILVNAKGTINERGYISGTATTGANQYTVDRWYVVTSGQSLSWVDASGVRTFTAPAGGVTQAIRAQNIVGGTYVLSYGEGSTALAQVNGITVANGATFTLPANTIARLKFSGGTFKEPQIEPGSVVTGFDSQNDESERFICQKYYLRPVVVFTVAGNGSAGGNRISDAVYFFPRMIGTPTAAVSTGSGVNITIGALSVSDTALTQIATSGAAGYCSYLFTVTSLDAEFT